MKLKKLFSIGVVVLLSATMLFAIDLSAGGGIDLGYMRQAAKASISQAGVSIDGKGYASASLFGINGFFDAQYFTAKMGLAFKVGDLKASYSYSVKTPGGSNSDSESDSDSNYKLTYFELGLFGKYPFKVGIAKLYPIAGINFRFNTKAKYKDINLKDNLSSDEKAALNAHYFVLGFGADVFVKDKLFIRPLGLFGIQMNSTEKHPFINEMVSQIPILLNIKSGFSYMFNIGVSVGYQFK